MDSKLPLTIFGIKIGSPEGKLFLIFLFLCFTVTFLTGAWDLGNSRVVFFHEAIFIAAYFLLMGKKSLSLVRLKSRSVVFAIILIWILSISLSFFFSPLNLKDIALAQNRYIETLCHMAFFVVLFDYFSSYDLPLKKYFGIILMANSVVVIHAFLIWHVSPDPYIHEKNMWFSQFPFSGHARHAGYNMLVATICGIALLFDDSLGRKVQILSWIGLVLVASCLFWLGGRGSILSLLVAFLFVIFLKIRSFKAQKKIFFFLFLAVCTSVAVSHKASKFDFNGIANSVERTIKSESANQLTKRRLTIWSESIGALKNEWLLGYGSQGYLFLPNRSLKKTVMPHNMFVQFLIEWGVLGTLLFTLLLSVLFIRGLTTLYLDSKPSYAFYAAMSAIALSILGLSDGTYFHGKPCFYLAIIFAVWMSQSKRGNVEKNKLGGQF